MALPYQELGNSRDQSHSAGLAGARGAGGVLTCFENVQAPPVLVRTSAGLFHPHDLEGPSYYFLHEGSQGHREAVAEEL